MVPLYPKGRADLGQKLAHYEDPTGSLVQAGLDEFMPTFDIIPKAPSRHNLRSLRLIFLFCFDLCNQVWFRGMERTMKSSGHVTPQTST